MPKKGLIVAAALALAAVALMPAVAGAQSRGIMITPLAAYQWGGTLKGYYGEARLNDAGNWGIALDIPVHHRDAFVELVYSRQETDLSYREYGVGSPPAEIFDIVVEYYHIGGLYTVDKDGPKPFGTMTLGATRFAPQNSIYGTEWKFSAAMGIGLIVPVSERIGIRTHARLLIPFLYSGGGLWCGPGGCSIGVSGGSSVLQGDIAVGLVIRL